jgi:hypothetical protein
MNETPEPADLLALERMGARPVMLARVTSEVDGVVLVPSAD